jgi:hypothetical protein
MVVIGGWPFCGVPLGQSDALIGAGLASLASFLDYLIHV